MLRTPTGPVLALATAAVLGAMACRPEVGRTTVYRATKLLRYGDGDTVTVYRVKYWLPRDGSPPFLEIDFAAQSMEAPSLRAFARRSWPAIAPYALAFGISGVLLTETYVADSGVVSGVGPASRGPELILRQRSDGLWYLEGDSEVLPPADTTGVPHIFEADGTPMRVRSMKPM